MKGGGEKRTRFLLPSNPTPGAGPGRPLPADLAAFLERCCAAPAGAGGGGKQIGLEDLFKLVAQACTAQAPPGLGEQLHALAQQLSHDPNAPAEIQALGRVLNHVLSGDRDPDLSALPPELAQAVQRLLDGI